VSASHIFESIELSVTGRAARIAPRHDREAPFRLLVIGDFSGRAHRNVSEPLASRRCHKIDIDSFDAVLGRLQPQLELVINSRKVALAFSSLDDFHPDRIFARTPWIRELSAEPPAVPQESPASARAPESNREMFARLLGETPEERGAAKPDHIQELIAQAVAPHIVAPADPSAAFEAAAIDVARSAQMRALIHHPAFQALEAAWRGVDFLVRNLETDDDLEISILDASKAELIADLGPERDLSESGLFKKVIEETIQTPGATSWSALVGDFFFAANEHDARCLACAGKIADAAGAPFLTSLDDALVTAAISRDGLHDPLWAALRSLSHARAIGVAAPRLLLRLPYGKATDAIESFAFEELEAPDAHAQFLWGNPAFGIARLIAESFAENGWDFTPGEHDELADLPHHTWRADGETRTTPCAERWLTDVAGERLIDAGIMPLLSIRGRNAVKVPRFQSIADPPAELMGRWAH
jgi:type VI secretion system protein ImpC